MPTNSFWLANAKAIYHAVGNDSKKSNTIVFRTLVSKEKYEQMFFPKGARHITKLLRKIQVRYFPVLNDMDVREGRTLLSQ